MVASAIDAVAQGGQSRLADVGHDKRPVKDLQVEEEHGKSH